MIQEEEQEGQWQERENKQEVENQRKEKSKSGYTKVQKATIFVAIITSFVTTFVGSALNLSVPAMGEQFGVSGSAIGWVVTIYMLVAAALSVPFGRIADLTCRKNVLVTGIGVFTVATLGAVFAFNLPTIILARGGQGLGAAMIFATNQAILISEFPGSDRGKVIGYATASTYVGLSAGPVIGGILNHYAGWKSIFMLTFAISIVVFVQALMKLPKRVSEMDVKKWDIQGNGIFVFMVLLTMYGLSSVGTNKYAPFMIAAGLIFGVLFIRHELKVESPIVDVRLFAHNKYYTLSNLAALLNYGATFAISYLLSIYLQVIMGFSSQIAGIILIACPVMQALLSPYAGQLSDRISPFKLASFGMGLCALSLFILIFVSSNTPIWLIILTLVIAGVGFAFFSSPNTNAIMSCVEKEGLGVAASVLATMRTLGHTTSMGIVTIIVGIYVGSAGLTEASPDALINTMHTAFIVFTILCLGGILCSTRRKNH